MRVELRGPDGRRLAIDVTVPVVLGRQGGDIHLDDPAVSRLHLRIEPAADDGSGTVLVAIDLGSTHGTWVNGLRISTPTRLREGDAVRLGDTELLVGGRRRAATLPPIAPPPDPAAGLTSVEDAGLVVRFRPGTPGADAAPGIVAAVRRVRRRLAGFGSEATAEPVEILLLDPFPDPRQPDEVVTAGTVVEPAARRIWAVVTAEAPPEPPGRALALLWGAALLAAGELQALIEGYGLWAGGAPDTAADLRSVALPPLADAAGEMRAAMGTSLAHFLVARDGEAALRRFLTEARPGPAQLDEAARDAFGLGWSALELAWRQALEGGDPEFETGRFLRLSLRLLRPYRRRQLEIGVLMLLSLAFNVVFPFVSRDLIDRAIPSGRFSEVLQSLGVLAAALAVSLVAGVRRADQTALVSGSVVRDLRTSLFERLQELPASWYGSHSQGDVLSRLFQGVARVEQGLSQAISEGAFQLLSIVVASAVMLRLNPLLGAVVLAGAPLVVLVYRRMGRGAQKRSLATQQESSAVYGVAAENYQAEQVVKLFGLAEREQERFRRASDRLLLAQRRLARYGLLFGLSVNSVVTGIRLIVLGLGAWLILEDRFTIGGLVAFLAVMGEVLGPVAEVTSLGQRLQEAGGALVKVEEVLDAEPEGGGDPSAPPLAALTREIHLDHVSFGYSSERRALQEVDVRIRAGAKVAFVGPSGSGKSTILRLLMRLHDPDEGAVRFDGVDVRSASLASLRDQLGVVLQDTFLFDTTIRENIALGRSGATPEEVEAAARAAEVDRFVTDLPRGYETVVGERGAALSGGQRQRVAIARALLRQPRLLLLDEATSALDPVTERSILATLERVSAERTVVAITHRLRSVAGYDRIIVVVDGRVVEEGTHRVLLAAGGPYSRLWAEQEGEPVGAAPATSDELRAALARVVLFAELDERGLEAVASRLRPLSLLPGGRLREGDGRLLLVASGRGRVIVPGLGGERVAAELGPGDAFGVAAVLGQPTGAALEADGPLRLLTLDDEALTALAAAHPEIAAARQGGRPSGVHVAAGQRLSRLSFTGLSAAAAV